MALTFTKDIESVYPVFNDSWVKFTSADPATLAELTVQDPVDLLSTPLVIYPNQNGEFIFNLKELAKISFSNDRFQFSEIPSLGWTGTIESHRSKLTINFSVTTSEGTEEATKSFYFFRGVQQVLEAYSIPTLLGLSNRLDYWPGFPFDLQFLGVGSSDEITIKNISTGFESSVLTVPTLAESDSFSLVLDNGVENWTSESFLPILRIDNILEIYKNGEIFSSIYLKQNDECSGVYLRWINSKGGVSYRLFNKEKKESLSSRSIGQISRNDFSNVDALTPELVNIGSTASESVTLKASVEKNKLNALKDLFFSPNIEVYSSTESNVPGSWIPVSINGSFTRNNKKGFSEVSISVDLPELITMTL